MNAKIFFPILFLGMLFSSHTWAQSRFNVTTQLVVKGYLLSAEKGKAFKESKVELRSNGKTVKTVMPDKKGFFELALDYNKMYTIHFTGPERVTEFIEVNTKGLDNVENTYSYEYQIKIRLRKKVEEVDYSMFNEPVAKIKFDHDLESFVRDEAYDKEVQSKLDALYKQLQEKQ